MATRSLEDTIKVLHDRVGGQWEGSEADGRDAIMDVLRHELGYGHDQAREIFDALLASGQLRYRRYNSEYADDAAADRGERRAANDDSVVDSIGVLPVVPIAAGLGNSGPTSGLGGAGLAPLAAGIAGGGGYWQIGRSQNDPLPPMAGRKGQVDPTA